MLLLLFGLLAGFSVCELSIRGIARTDEDGNVTVLRRQLKPYRLPVKAVQEAVDSYAASDTSFVLADSDLGWNHRPDSRSDNGLYFFNSQRIRTSPDRPEFAPEPERGVLRIALFGDSFTHGDDVPFECTWGDYLERTLREKGLPTEVLNFGVGGYGFGQAYWRWQREGRRFNPDIVILGFQPTDTLRTVNILRPLAYLSPGLPFAKPRYLERNGRLDIINHPALPPEEVPSTLAGIDRWELADKEWFYDAADYERRFWQLSRTLALLERLLYELSGRAAADELASYSLANEPAQLSLATIHSFAAEAGADGAAFMLVHLPKWSHLEMLQRRKLPPYADLLRELEHRYEVIDPGQALAEAWIAHGAEEVVLGHYSPLGNRIVADVVAQRLSDLDPRSLTPRLQKH